MGLTTEDVRTMLQSRESLEGENRSLREVIRLLVELEFEVVDDD
jgi:hypothetical protein